MRYGYGSVDANAVRIRGTDITLRMPRDSKSGMPWRAGAAAAACMRLRRVRRERAARAALLSPDQQGFCTLAKMSV